MNNRKLKKNSFAKRWHEKFEPIIKKEREKKISPAVDYILKNTTLKKWLQKVADQNVPDSITDIDIRQRQAARWIVENAVELLHIDEEQQDIEGELKDSTQSVISYLNLFDKFLNKIPQGHIEDILGKKIEHRMKDGSIHEVSISDFRDIANRFSEEFSKIDSHAGKLTKRKRRLGSRVKFLIGHFTENVRKVPPKAKIQEKSKESQPRKTFKEFDDVGHQFIWLILKAAGFGYTHEDVRKTIRTVSTGNLARKNTV